MVSVEWRQWCFGHAHESMPRARVVCVCERCSYSCSRSVVRVCFVLCMGADEKKSCVKEMKGCADISPCSVTLTRDLKDAPCVNMEALCSEGRGKRSKTANDQPDARGVVIAAQIGSSTRQTHRVAISHASSVQSLHRQVIHHSSSSSNVISINSAVFFSGVSKATTLLSSDPTESPLSSLPGFACMSRT